MRHVVQKRFHRAVRVVHKVAEIAGLREAPRRVVLMHIPKSAGTTLNFAAKSYLGSARKGSVVVLDDRTQGAEWDEHIARAKDAAFVGGHFGFETLEKVRKDAFVFTILRDPYERLRSVYGYLMAITKNNPLPDHLKSVSIEEFFSSQHDVVRQWSDNVLARMMAQAWDINRLTLPNAEAMAEAALEHLEQFDFVGFMDTLDRDMTKVAAATRVSSFAELGQRNTTKSLLKSGGQLEATAPPSERMREIVAPWVRHDLAVYEAAKRRFGAIQPEGVTARTNR